jgi:hypothetical protein
VAVALVDDGSGQGPEESVDVWLAHQQIERELHDVGLRLRQALGATALRGFVMQRGAKHIRIAFARMRIGLQVVVTGRSRFHFPIIGQSHPRRIVQKSQIVLDGLSRLWLAPTTEGQIPHLPDCFERHTQTKVSDVVDFGRRRSTLLQESLSDG